jgi:hypothetical protein
MYTAPVRRSLLSLSALLLASFLLTTLFPAASPGAPYILLAPRGEENDTAQASTSSFRHLKDSPRWVSRPPCRRSSPTSVLP